LIDINGAYQLLSPIELLSGVGDKNAITLRSIGIFTVNDIIDYRGSDKQIISIKNKNGNLLDKIFSK